MEGGTVVEETTRPTPGSVAKLVDRLSKDLANTKPLDSANIPLRKGFPLQSDLSKKSPKQSVKARFSYSPKHDDELELKVNDIIEVIGQAEDGWYKGKINGKEGVFPANFVTQPFTSSEGDQNIRPNSRNDELSGAGDASQNSSSQSPQEIIQPKKVKGVGFGNILGGGVKLRPTRGSSSEEKKIEFMNKDNNKPSASGDTNLLAAESQVASLSPKPPAKLKNVPSVEYCRVEYDYEAENDDELPLKAGDIVVVLSKKIDDPGWWLGEYNGKKGVFPDNFVIAITNEEALKEKKPIAPNLPAHPPTVPLKPKPGGLPSPKPQDRPITPEPATVPKPKQPTSYQSMFGPTSEPIRRSPIGHALPGDLSAALKDKLVPMAQKEIKEENEKQQRQSAPVLPKKALFQKSKAPVIRSKTLETSKPSDSLPRSSPVKSDSVVIDTSEDVSSPELDRLIHPTTSRPKQPNKRPPSQVFLLRTRDESPPIETNLDTKPYESTNSPVSKPITVKTGPQEHVDSSLPKAPSMPPPEQASPNPPPITSLPSPPSVPKVVDEVKIVENDKNDTELVPKWQMDNLRKEFESYKHDTNARIAELERIVKNLAQRQSM